nr:MAG TPA: hypothetical protein [Caudoviricetes sp.]
MSDQMGIPGIEPEEAKIFLKKVVCEVTMNTNMNN